MRLLRRHLRKHSSRVLDVAHHRRAHVLEACSQLLLGRLQQLLQAGQQQQCALICLARQLLRTQLIRRLGRFLLRANQLLLSLHASSIRLSECRFRGSALEEAKWVEALLR